MLSAIKICFSLYFDSIKNIIKSDMVYDVEKMSIEDIENEVNVIHMKYILSCAYSVSHNSIQYASFEHLENMIKKYHEIYDGDDKLNIDDDNKLNIDGDKNKRNGWFSRY
jgi:hypothetical protein